MHQLYQLNIFYIYCIGSIILYATLESLVQLVLRHQIKNRRGKCLLGHQNTMFLHHLCVCVLGVCGGGGEAHSSSWVLFPLLCSADLSSKDPFSSSHIWLLCVTLVMTLLEGQRWPLSLSPQRPIQTHRLWTVSSASYHQRSMHPEGIRGPLTDWERLVFTKERKKKATQMKQ